MGHKRRTIRNINIKSSDKVIAGRCLTKLEDAFNTASFPGIPPNGILLVRYLNLGRFSETCSSTTLSLLIEKKLRNLSSDAVRVDNQDHPNASAVWFSDAVQPFIALIGLIAEGKSPTAWYWRSAIPDWKPAMTRGDAVLTLLAGAMQTSAGVFAVARVLDKLLKADRLDIVLHYFTPQFAVGLLNQAGIQPHDLTDGKASPSACRPLAQYIDAGWQGAILEWLRIWGTQDARSLLLVYIAALNRNPAISESPDVLHTVRQVAEVLIKRGSVPSLAVSDPTINDAELSLPAAAEDKPGATTKPLMPQAAEDLKAEEAGSSMPVAAESKSEQDAELSKPLTAGNRPKKDAKLLTPLAAEDSVEVDTGLSIPATADMPLEKDVSLSAALEDITRKNTELDRIAANYKDQAHATARIDPSDQKRHQQPGRQYPGQASSEPAPVDPGKDKSEHTFPTGDLSRFAGLIFVIPLFDLLGMRELLKQHPHLAAINFPARVIKMAGDLFRIPPDDAVHDFIPALVEPDDSRISQFAAPAVWETLVFAPRVKKRILSCHRIADDPKKWVLTDKSRKIILAVGTSALIERLPAWLTNCDWKQTNEVLPHPDIDSLIATILILSARYLRRFAGVGLPNLVKRSGLVATTRTHIDVIFDLHDADVRIRKIGLDVDPGWVAWFGRIIQFHYVTNEG